MCQYDEEVLAFRAALLERGGIQRRLWAAERARNLNEIERLWPLRNDAALKAERTLAALEKALVTR